jgi:hypothetical protein
VAWSRLREIASKDIAHGGIGLFRDTSQQCRGLFGKSPSAIIATKPETYLKFLKLLEGKEHLLHKLAVRDLEQILLGVEARADILNLGTSIMAFPEGSCRIYRISVRSCCISTRSILQLQPPLHGMI